MAWLLDVYACRARGGLRGFGFNANRVEDLPLRRAGVHRVELVAGTVLSAPVRFAVG